MDELAGVLLQMDPVEPDLPRTGGGLDGDAASFTHRQVVLRDLVALGQIRIEVVLAGEHRRAAQLRAHRQTHAQGHLHRIVVQDGQRTGHAQADRTGVLVRRRPEGRGTAAEDLGAGSQLRMDLEPDDQLVIGGLERMHGNRSVERA